MKIIERAEITSSESLSKRVVKGGIWVFALRITNRGLVFIRTIILARLLAPNDFGLLGIAMLSIATLETFSQTGFQAALIQKKGDITSYLDTAWTVSAIRGIVLFLVLFLSAPIIAQFFNSSQATAVIMVIAISPLLSGFRNIGIMFFQKELEFNKQFIYELSGTLVNLTVAITLAFILRNVWALVWGGVAAHFIRLFMSHILHPYRPRLRFNKSEFKELFAFGKWVLSSSILFFLLTQGDDIFVGKILGVTALGLYQMAYLVSNLPATEITHVISQVTFPAYSKLQDDLSKLREAYIKVLQLTAFISIPLAGGIFILAPDFTQIFLGEKWMLMISAMQMLCIFGLTRSINATFGPFFQGIGKPDILTKASFGQLLIMILLIYPLTSRWNIMGTSISIIVPNILVLFYLTKKLAKDMNFALNAMLKSLLLPAISMTIACIFMSIFKLFWASNLINFLLILTIGVVLYFCFIYFMDMIFDYRLIRNIKEITVNI